MTMERERERKKISQLAREYSERGYEVLTELPGFSSPSPVGGWRPDLIIRKGDEVIIVEVKTSETIKTSKEKVQHLAEYAKTHPGIRFDLVLTNPRPQFSSKRRSEGLDRELRALEQSLLQNLEVAAELNQHSLASILAHILLEGLLTRAAEKRGVKLEHETSSLVERANKLYDKEVISTAVLDLVRRVSDARNQVVHGHPLQAQFNLPNLYEKIISLYEEW